MHPESQARTHADRQTLPPGFVLVLCLRSCGSFDDSADGATARAQVYERLGQAKQTLSSGVGTPTKGPLSTGPGEILEFELRGPGHTPLQLHQLLRYTVAPQFQLVPRIASVDLYGGELDTYEVQLSPERLHAHQLSLPDVFRTIQANTEARGGVSIDRNDQ